VDQVRDLNGRGVKHAVTASSGAHVTLPEWYGSTGVGMIVPKTKVRNCCYQGRPVSSQNVSLASLFVQGRYWCYCWHGQHPP
jgi:hypothetical protein